MSAWTHVVGSFRIDSLVGFDSLTVEKIKEIIGKECRFDDWFEESTLPRGSEGSMQYLVHEYGDGLPWVIVSVWGDLRDFSVQDFDVIKQWWRDLLNKHEFSIRDAVLKIQSYNNVVLLTDAIEMDMNIPQNAY